MDENVDEEKDEDLDFGRSCGTKDRASDAALPQDSEKWQKDPKTLEKYQKEITYYQKAIQILPSFSEAYYNLGNILNKTREYQGAMKCYEKAIQITPNFIGAHNNLGSLFEDLGEHHLSLIHI